MAKKTLKNAKIRLYDSAATPYYLEIDLDPGDFSGPIGTPLTEEKLVLDRGNMNANAHYIEGPDDPMMAPVNISFSFPITDAQHCLNVLNWFKAMNDAMATQVNSITLATCETDFQRDGATANPAFADSLKSTCIVEYVIEMGSPDIGWKYGSVWFPMSELQLSEAEDGVMISVTGHVYGTITQLTAFTAGTDVEA